LEAERKLGEILSQKEIDTLLQNLNTGEFNMQDIKMATQEKKIRKHDFRRPSKFSKEHLKALRSIYENYARLTTNFLTAYLRTPVQIEVLEIESLAYTDFISSIINPAILGVTKLLPLEGSVIFNISANIAFVLIDRILGGKGAGVEDVREFTEIEIAILERIITQMLNIMGEPWKDVMPIRPMLERIETGAQFAQLFSPNEIVVLITLKITVSKIEGMLNVCIPYITGSVNKNCARAKFMGFMLGDIKSKMGKPNIGPIAIYIRGNVKTKAIINLTHIRFTSFSLFLVPSPFCCDSVVNSTSSFSIL
jgi:flagellar motor switch protein FliM